MSDDSLRLRNVATTLIGCLGERGELANAQGEVLMAAEVAWAITGHELRLTRGNTTLVYRAR